MKNQKNAHLSQVAKRNDAYVSAKTRVRVASSLAALETGTEPTHTVSDAVLNAKVGALLRKWRTGEGLTQEWLAQRLGVTRNSVVNIEKGRQALTIHTLIRAADALAIPVAALLPDSTPADEVASHD